eukprot:COSAG05_NODE_1223_length_5468_cov_31.139877_3_plen_566_part_00
MTHHHRLLVGSIVPGSCHLGGLHTQLHVVPTGGGFVTNTWGWGADHDLKTFNGSFGTNVTGPCTQPSCCVQSLYGLRNEGRQPMTWLGTAFEHHTVGGYTLDHAANQLFLMTQTEQPYWNPYRTTSRAFSIRDTVNSSVYGGYYGAGESIGIKPGNNAIGIMAKNTSAVNLLQVFSFASANLLESDGTLVQGRGPFGGLPSLVANLNMTTTTAVPHKTDDHDHGSIVTLPHDSNGVAVSDGTDGSRLATSIEFSPPVKMGMSAEPGYCYDFQHMTTTLQPSTTCSPAVICASEAGDRVTIDGGHSWVDRVTYPKCDQPTAATLLPTTVADERRRRRLMGAARQPKTHPPHCNSTFNELLHLRNGGLQSVVIAPPTDMTDQNRSWLGPAAGILANTYTRDPTTCGVRLSQVNLGPVKWGPIPRPSLLNAMRLHQQGSVTLKDGSLLQLSVVYWGPLAVGKSGTLLAFRSVDEGKTFSYRSTVALGSDFNSTWEGEIDAGIVVRCDRNATWTDFIRCNAGPGNENSIAMLKNSSLLVIMRMKFDTNYMRLRSDDQVTGYSIILYVPY